MIKTTTGSLLLSGLIHSKSIWLLLGGNVEISHAVVLSRTDREKNNVFSQVKPP